MSDILDSGLLWWITGFDLPVFGGLFWLIWRTRIESGRAIDDLHHTIDTRSSQLREALFSFKLEVARTYAPISELKDLESRLVEHLLRIEAKLDKTALKAAALKGGGRT